MITTLAPQHLADAALVRSMGFGHAAGRKAANESAPMRRYVVTIGARGQARLLFEAMGRSSAEVAAQHLGLCRPLERCDVRAVS